MAQWANACCLPTMQGLLPRKGAPVNRLLASAVTAALLTPAVAALATDLPTFDPHRLSQEVRTLSSDAFEGRGPATPGETKTVDYVVAQFKAAGLQPGGAIVEGKRTWTQPVPLGRFEIVGTPTFSLSEDGKAMPLTQGEQIAVRAAMDGSRKVEDRKSTRLNSSHVEISYAVFCLKKKKKNENVKEHGDAAGSRATGQRGRSHGGDVCVGERTPKRRRRTGDGCSRRYACRQSACVI